MLRSSSGIPIATRESHTLCSAASAWSGFLGPSRFSGSCAGESKRDALREEMSIADSNHRLAFERQGRTVDVQPTLTHLRRKAMEHYYATEHRLWKESPPGRKRGR